MSLPPRAVDIAADDLRGRILTGEWPAGHRLPPERRLAEELGISRLTLRAALSKLEAEGLTQARQGSGITVQDWRDAGSVGLLAHLIAYGGLEWVPAFLELRRALATEVLGLVATKATDAELDDLAEHALAVSNAPNREALMAGNLSFSKAIVRLTDNMPMLLLFNTLERSINARADLASALIADEDAVRASFPLVVGLLRTRDPASIRTAARAALERIDAATLARLEMQS